MPLKSREARLRYATDYQQRRYYEDPEYRKRHLALVSERTRRVRDEMKKICSAFREQGCFFCKEKHPCCLDAHHLDAALKEYTVGELVRRAGSIKKLVSELAKCVCLCKNCHAKVHAGLLVIEGAPPALPIGHSIAINRSPKSKALKGH